MIRIHTGGRYGPGVTVTNLHPADRDLSDIEEAAVDAAAEAPAEARLHVVAALNRVLSILETVLR